MFKLLLLVVAIFSTSFGIQETEFFIKDIETKQMKQDQTPRAMFIDKSGRMVIDTDQYDHVLDFSEGLAAVQTDDGYNFIDKSGNTIIRTEFHQIHSFSEGLAAIGYYSKWGYIDKTGRVVIEPQYDVVGEFSEGVAVVKKDEKFLLIDKTGQKLWSHNTNEIFFNIYENTKFSEGLIDVYDSKTAKTGYMDKTGKFVIEPQFKNAVSFSEGLARVEIIVDGKPKIGFIDNSGKFAVPPVFGVGFDFIRNSLDFSEGLASLTNTEDNFFYVDKTGAIALQTSFFYADSFHEGLAAVYDGDNDKWGYINKSGNVAIPLQFVQANKFSEGMAYVILNKTD